MDKGQRSKIVIKLPSEFSSRITVGDATYDVQTEDMAPSARKLVTRVYHGGRIVFTKEADYSHLLKLRLFDSALRDFMEKKHDEAVGEFVSGTLRKPATKAEYLSEARKLLGRGAGQAALELIGEGLQMYPSEPFLLSYYGCLLAVVGQRPSEGIKACGEAIKRLEESVPFGSEFFHPTLYLNLGRAHLAGGDRAGAIAAFKRGLKTDPENSDILWEMRKLGRRRKPPLPFLKRGSLLNKYIGLLMSKARSG